jgi:DNA-binding transcriptional LysR family regulator
VRRILSEVAEAESSAQAERLAPSGRLLVSAPASFGRIHVGPLMADYLKQHPGVSGELMLSDRFVNLVEEGYDLALRIGVLSDSSLVARREVFRELLHGLPLHAVPALQPPGRGSGADRGTGAGQPDFHP